MWHWWTCHHCLCWRTPLYPYPEYAEADRNRHLSEKHSWRPVDLWPEVYYRISHWPAGT